MRKEDHLIDMDHVRSVALETRPKLIIAGASAYPRAIDFAAFHKIADEVGAYLMVDMAHYAGLILTNDEALAKKFNSAVFPANQGGPLMHVIAAKAVALGEALQPSFKTYCQQVVTNAQALSDTLKQGGLDIVSGGTDTHLVLVDLRPMGVTGRDAEEALERAGLTCNKNSIPFDPEKPFVTSGVRLGTAAGTTRGFGSDEFVKVGKWVLEVVQALSQSEGKGDPAIESRVLEQVQGLCTDYPIYATEKRS